MKEESTFMDELGGYGNIYKLGINSEPLTSAEELMLEAYCKKMDERYGGKNGIVNGYNTITLYKRSNGTWQYRRVTWTQGLSTPKSTLEELISGL